MPSGLAPNLYSLLLLPPSEKKKYQFCRLLLLLSAFVTLVGYFFSVCFAYHSNTYLLPRFFVLAFLFFVSLTACLL